MNPLISVEELRKRLGEAQPMTILDVRWQLGGPSGMEEFAAAHIPGSVFVDLGSSLASGSASPAGGGGRHPLPDPAVFQQVMQAAGVSAERPVVVLDDWQARAAGRGWWLLRDAGHPDVRVLDGGFAAWQRAGAPVASGAEPAPQRTDWEARPGQLPRIAADQVGEVDVLIDARHGERYRGEVEPVDPVAGHIPGAVNVPTGDNLTPEGHFRSPAELAACYAGAGVVPGTRVGVYCGSGVTACHDLLALASAGIEGALYPGSWSGWVSDPNRPVAIGDESEGR